MTTKDEYYMAIFAFAFISGLVAFVVGMVSATIHDTTTYGLSVIVMIICLMVMAFTGFFTKSGDKQ